MALERVTFNCLIIHIYLVCTIKNDIKECQIENPKEIQLQTAIAHSHGLATSCLWHRTIFASTPDLVDHIQMISPTWHCKNSVLLCSPKDPYVVSPSHSVVALPHLSGAEGVMIHQIVMDCLLIHQMVMHQTLKDIPAIASKSVAS